MEVIVIRKDKQRYTYSTADLSSVALSLTTVFGIPFKLNQITAHFDSASSNVINVYRDSGIGSDYDALIKTNTMNGTETDWEWRPTGGDCMFLDRLGTQDEILVSIAKAGSCNIFLTVDVEEI